MNRCIEIRSGLDETIEAYKSTKEVSVSLVIETSDNITPQNPVGEDEEGKDSFAYLCKFAEEVD